jgi:drug/metabolite transporter (DMT)-like permease
MHRYRKLKVLSLAVLVVGVLLTGMMVATESEPGAIPLALVLLGAMGYAIAMLKGRRD